MADAAPEAGTAGPASLPLPDDPLGGERMDECGAVLPAGAPPPPVGITAASWLIADLDTGEVLAAKDPHGRHRPASTIKLLTALLTVEELPLDRVVTTTPADADIEGSSAGIGPGGRYTVRQLLAGLLLVSGNDAAHALARTIGGQPTTLAAMNARARELGTTDTRARTPSGLDAPGMSSSAYDMALIFREVLRQPVLARLLATPDVAFPGYGEHSGYVLGNQNRLLANYDGALGGKTGFTDDARHTFVGAAERDGHRLVTVLMRAEQEPTRTWEQAARLLDYGFALQPGTAVGRLVTGPPAPQAPATTPPPAQCGLPAGGSASAGADPDGAEAGTGAVIGSLLAGTAVLAGLLALLPRTRLLGTRRDAGSQRPLR